MREKKLRPFVKWAGGKGQLIETISNTYPYALGGEINKYAEPFVGGGAVLFDILDKYELDAVYISDINAELINAYRMVRDSVDEIIAQLFSYQLEYNSQGEESQKKYYYKKRDRFNELKMNDSEIDNVECAALFIFLNRTCFNGLYRVNRKGQFNVPMGSYKNPLICDEENLRNASMALQKVTIVCGDYRKSREFIDQNTFVYFDPPYRPLNITSSFTSYTENEFNDDDQRALAAYVSELNDMGAYVVVSNSDPKNTDPQDDFFDNLYSMMQINRIHASRMINSNAESRGKISELLIQNYL